MVKVAPAGEDTASVSSSSSSSSKSSSGGQKRDQWGNTVEFILSCIGYAVGLGNLTRFPYICGRNGGGAFLIPYFIMLILCGLPTFYMELSLGQFAQVTPYYIYRRMCPLFRGIGYSMISISAFTSGYYNIYMAWSFIYFYDTIYYTIAGGNLPYKGCDHHWNTETCFDLDEWKNCNVTLTDPSTNVYWMGQCYGPDYFNDTTTPTKQHVLDRDAMLAAGQGDSSSQQYNDHVLGYNRSTPVFTDWGLPTWQLTLSLFVSWLVVFAILSKGVHSAGKVMYFTALFPYVILTALLIQGNMLPNSYKGLEFYIVPDFEKLMSPGPWIDAASQIFFSTSVAAGGLATLSSFNQFTSNVRRDTFIVVLSNCATSIYAGFVIFPILGFEAGRLGTNVSSLAKEGPTLAFVAYPGALAEMPVAPLWAISFFFMLLMLGIDSEVVMVEVVIAAIVDRFPKLRKTAWHKAAFTGVICFFYFAIGIIMLTPSGPELVNLIDTFAGGWTLVFVGMFEVFMVSWIYGVKRFFGDIIMMLGVAQNACYKAFVSVLNVYMVSTWAFIIPILLLAVISFTFVDFEFTYNDRDYPMWGHVLGFCMAGFCLIHIPLQFFGMIGMKIIKKKPWSWLVTPTKDWGPKGRALRQRIEIEHPAYGSHPQTLRQVMFSDPPPITQAYNPPPITVSEFVPEKNKEYLQPETRPSAPSIGDESLGHF